MGIRDQIRHGSSRDVLDQFAAAHDPASTLARVGPDNPTRARCAVELIVADGPSAKGRVAAIVNPRLTDDSGAPLGLLGFYAADRNPDTTRWMFDLGCEWLARQGCRTVRGPVNFTTWHDYRLVTRVHDDVAIPGEPVHPDYYPDLWRAAEFTECTRYATNWLPDLAHQRERFDRVMRRAREGGYTLRPIEASDLPHLYRLAMEVFAGAYMFSPIEPDEFAALYTADRAAAVAGTTNIALAPDGEPLGFIYTFDVQHGDRVAGVVKTIGVAPRARRTGLYALLLGDFFERCLAEGNDAIGALMHADGDPGKLGWVTPETMIKEYALYERSL